MHEWMADNGQTPHIVVDATQDGVVVPPEHISDGKIILNISQNATGDLSLGNDRVHFTARFGGVPYEVVVPVPAVLGIYARETGQGMIFSGDHDQPEPPDEGPSPASGGRPNLKVVK